jgi:hypothetical protein
MLDEAGKPIELGRGAMGIVPEPVKAANHVDSGYVEQV